MNFIPSNTFIFLMLNGLITSLVGGHFLNSNEGLFDDNYDPGVAPTSQGESGVEVQVILTIEELEEINDESQEMIVSILIEESWHDPRLNRSQGSSTLEEKSEALIEDTSRIWNPEIHILKMRQVASTKMSIKVDKKGLVTKLTKARLGVACPMNFFYFPFDRHSCSIKFTNFDYSRNELNYSWKMGIEKSIEIEEEVTLTNKFGLTGYQLTQSTRKGFLGNHSELEAKLFVVRKGGRNFPFYYFPAITLAAISFISLWMSNIILAISLAAVSFVTMIVYWILVQSHVPSNTFEMGMLDHYYFLCLNMIFNAFVVNVILYGFCYSKSAKVVSNSSNSDSKSNGKVVVEMKSLNALEDSGSDSCADEPKKSLSQHELRIREMSKFKQFVYFKVSKPAKYQLPIGFSIVNLVYWMWIIIATISSFPKDFQKFNSLE